MSINEDLSQTLPLLQEKINHLTELYSNDQQNQAELMTTIGHIQEIIESSLKSFPKNECIMFEEQIKQLKSDFNELEHEKKNLCWLEQSFKFKWTNSHIGLDSFNLKSRDDQNSTENSIITYNDDFTVRSMEEEFVSVPVVQIQTNNNNNRQSYFYRKLNYGEPEEKVFVGSKICDNEDHKPKTGHSLKKSIKNLLKISVNGVSNTMRPSKNL